MELNSRLKALNELLSLLKNNFTKTSQELDEKVLKLEYKNKYLRKFSDILSSFSSDTIAIESGCLVTKKEVIFPASEFVYNYTEQINSLYNLINLADNVADEENREKLLKNLSDLFEEEILSNIISTIAEVNLSLECELYVDSYDLTSLRCCHDDNDNCYLIAEDSCKLNVILGIK